METPQGCVADHRGERASSSERLASGEKSEPIRRRVYRLPKQHSHQDLVEIHGSCVVDI